MTSTAPARAVVNLGAYGHNLGVVRRMIPEDCATMAVVKADAYGHGAVPIARRAVETGVTMLGVATVDEGIALRQSGIDVPILVLLQPAHNALAAVVEHGLHVMISDVATAERLGELARRVNKVVSVHCKVDSGMGRQGFDIDAAVADLLYLTRVSHVDIVGVATHFSVADSAGDPFTANQIRQFKQLLRLLDKEGIPYELAHAANSAAIVNHPGSAFNMVRPGLITYGVWPTEPPPSPPPTRPVLRWETQVVLVKDLEPGSSVGYGRTYTTPSRMRAAVLPVGYADGYKHSLSNRADVLISGRRCPVRGRVSMDQIVVDVTEVEGVESGDIATLIGDDGNERITVEELARRAQTIPYEILTGIGPRVQRVYVD